jgi:hypothetical protein
MKMTLHFSMALALAATCLLQANLSAQEKKGKETVVNDELKTTDLKDKVRTTSYCKTYTFKMIEGRSYQIDLNSVWDNYLRLEDPKGDQVAEDDDGGGFPNARIVYRAPKTGDYTIICTSFTPGATGKYTLTVKDLTGGAEPKEEKKDKLRPAPGQSSFQSNDGAMPFVSAGTCRVDFSARARED